MESRIFNVKIGTGRRTNLLTIYLGILSIIVPSAFIIASVMGNPWFSIMKNAFSDLGAVTANMQWVFNIGLIVSAAVVFAFAIGLIEISENKVQVTGSAFLVMTAIFLAMIGVFYEGTSPHFLFSVLFFAEAALSVLVWGLGLLVQRSYVPGTAMVAMSLAGAVISVTVKFPSIALLEAFGIIIMFVWVIMMVVLIKGRLWREQ